MNDLSKCWVCSGKLAMTKVQAFYLTKDGGVSKVKVSAFKELPSYLRSVIFCTNCGATRFTKDVKVL